MAMVWIGEQWCLDAKDYAKKYILDTEDDVKALPMCCAGSTALVCSTGNVYIVNASGQWVKLGGGDEPSENPSDEDVSLEVKKITANTYDFDTSTLRESESFVALLVYPKGHGTVNVSYGGLTKSVSHPEDYTHTGEGIPVFFGTFKGVSDDVPTPESGTLTISGDYSTFGQADYYYDEKNVARAQCITGINSLGKIESIGPYAFMAAEWLTDIVIPDTVTTIDYSAFSECPNLASVTIPDGVTSIWDVAFNTCPKLLDIAIPASVTFIGQAAFYLDSALGISRTVRMAGSVPPTLREGDAFDMPGTNRIVVPAGANLYKTYEHWCDYAEYITEAEG